MSKAEHDFETNLSYDLERLKMKDANTDIYGIVVKFKNREGWSREYTYAHTEAVEPDSLVVVPNNDNFVSVARVKKCIYKYKFLPGIGYKNIVEVLKTTAKDL